MHHFMSGGLQDAYPQKAAVFCLIIQSWHQIDKEN
jgi:hypothetical protein